MNASTNSQSPPNSQSQSPASKKPLPQGAASALPENLNKLADRIHAKLAESIPNLGSDSEYMRHMVHSAWIQRLPELAESMFPDSTLHREMLLEMMLENWKGSGNYPEARLLEGRPEEQIAHLTRYINTVLKPSKEDVTRTSDVPAEVGGSRKPRDTRDDSLVPEEWRKFLLRPKHEIRIVRPGAKKKLDLSNPDRIVVAPVPARSKRRSLQTLATEQTTIWLTTGPTLTRWTSKPDFPKPVPNIPPKIAVKKTRDMGFGIFATHDIQAHEIVLAERPFMIYPASLNYVAPIRALAYVHMDDDEIERLRLLHSEPVFRKAFQAMTECEREEFLMLPGLGGDGTEGAGSEPLLANATTIGLPVDFACDETYYQFEDGYKGIPRIGSRFNHSCVPNLLLAFDQKTFSYIYFAARPIKAGSQLFLSYTNIYQPKATRQARLARYNFTCHCLACEHATPQRDKLRQTCKTLIDNWVKQSETVWMKDPKLKESVLNPLLALKKRMEEDGLDSREAGYWELHPIMYRVYTKLGLTEKAKAALRVWFEYQWPVISDDYKEGAKQKFGFDFGLKGKEKRVYISDL
ncbi:hypothetical protein CC2G_014623 [Coprinopsis cinerea AmutBmut pab1-1]|nr:hypothetical protein CC2G_014623 [Coprinopsis cinerea AmutBmut pab1-1]